MTSTSDLACSALARRLGRDPIGSAGHYRGYLLVEWPLPWPRDLGEVPALSGVAAAVKAASWRLQGLVPVRREDRLEVVAYRWTGDPGAGRPGSRFERSSRSVVADEVAATALELLAAAAYPPADPGSPDLATEVLVCTHGRRDRCCGSLGTRLAAELAADGELAGLGVVVRRTSHTGGHRFAPTAVVLPEGTAWAFADLDLVKRVVTRSGAVDAVLSRYRGCAGVGPAPVQVLEREVLSEVGWAVLGAPRSGSVLEDGRVRLVVDSAEPIGGTYEATVRVTDQVAVPVCGEEIEQATEFEPSFSIEALRQV